MRFKKYPNIINKTIGRMAFVANKKVSNMRITRFHSIRIHCIMFTYFQQSRHKEKRGNDARVLFHVRIPSWCNLAYGLNHQLYE